MEVLAEFGSPFGGIDVTDFANPSNVFQMGVPPCRIDFIMDIAGITFSSARRQRVRTELSGVPVYVIGRSHLIRAKKSAGRPYDMIDLMLLAKHSPRRKRMRRKK